MTKQHTKLKKKAKQEEFLIIPIISIIIIIINTFLVIFFKASVISSESVWSSFRTWRFLLPWWPGKRFWFSIHRRPWARTRLGGWWSWFRTWFRTWPGWRSFLFHHWASGPGSTFLSPWWPRGSSARPAWWAGSRSWPVLSGRPRTWSTIPVGKKLFIQNYSSSMCNLLR